MDEVSVVFPGNSELARLCRAFPWEQSPLGSVSSWPASMKSVVSVLIQCTMPMIMYAGKDFVCIYNDAYAPSLGKKHPHAALGLSCRQVWKEIWPVIGPDMERALDSGVSKHFEDCLLFLERSSDTGGSAEESYHSFSLTPVGVESGSINSLLVSVVEVTDKVIAKRRLQFRNELSSRLSKAHCSNDIFSHVRCMCDPWLPDLPYALLYRVLDGNDTNVSVSLVAASGLPEDHPLVSSLFADGEEHMPANTESGVTMVDTIDLASHSWGGRPCNRAAIVPMISPVTQRPFGYLVCGVNPARPVDADYIDFFRLLSDSVATAMANVDALDAERQRAEELAKIDAAKTMFFSNISHEFRTPLSLIVASVTDALADDSLDSLCSSQRERMVLVQRNAQRLLRLVNSLLDFSRIEAGRASAHFSPTDVRQVTAELTSCFESLFEKGGLQLSLESENVSEPVYLDLLMWEKIVTNLLSNAFKFTLEGSVTIRLRQEQEQNRESGVFLMEVEDTGVGIPSDEVQHLFERFHRVERSSGRTFEGSGIGLALVNELVKLHGGTISVRTEYGKGSCFTVCVPLGYAHLDPRQVGHERVSDMQLADRFLSPMSTVSSSVVEALQWTASPPHARKKDLDSNVSRQVVSRSRAGSTTESEAINTKLRHADGVCIRRKSYHVLLADDNADMRQYISKVLSCIAHVDTVNDGLAALQALQSDVGYDLVVSDVMMPQLSGFELISRMKETPSLASIPVILLSARAGHEATVEGLERGADDYIVKTSFSAQELIARVRNQLELQSLRYHLEEQIVDRTRDLQKLNASLQREIEDRKRAQKAVVDSEKRYRALAAVSPVGIGHAEPDGRVTYANPCLQELFCLTEDEFAQGVWVQQILPADRPHFAAAWNAYCNESEVSQLFCYTFQVQNSHGAVNWLLLQAIPEVDEDTNMRSGFLFAVTDISAQKTAEQQRLEESARSEEVQRARAVEAEGNKKKLQDFIDTVCHEVRNPLSGTFLNLDLQEDIVDRLSQLANLHGNAPRMSMDEYAEAIDQMATDLRDCILSIRLCSEHQRNVFNQVIELSRIESGKVAVENSDFVVQDALSEVYSMHEALFRRKRLHSRCSMPPEPVIVHADLVRFKQVIINLVNNAVKYSPEGASIHIQMEPLSHNNEKPQLVFRVEDTGPGFTEDEKKQLFERFARASRSRGGSFSEENNSSGLGLAICKATTQLLGGSIDLESEFGRGSTFIVSFPWSYRIASSPFSSSPQEKQNNAADGSVQDQEQHTQKRVRILVADDNHIGRRALEKILSKRGHEIALAKDGLQAVQTYSEFRPSVVLMDIEMPHVDGLEATRRIRAYEAQHNLPRAKIFAVSGYAREETQREALAAGMDGYLPKPFKPHELEAVLQRRE